MSKENPIDEQEKPPFKEAGLGELRKEEKETLEEKETIREPEPEAKKEEITYAPPPTVSDEEVKVQKEADKLREIKVEGRKIEHLLELAQSKGVDFAVEVAKKTQDACLLDLFHDKLIEKGLHKKIE